MKKLLIAASVLIAAFLIGPAARAALLGSVDASNISTSSTTFPPVAIYLINQATPTTLNTTVMDNSTTLIRKYGSYLFYTDTAGLQKLAVGGATPSALKAGSGQKLIAGKAALLIVGSNTSSYIYDVKKGKSASFKPKVKTIQSADLTDNGKVLIMIAKNSRGQSKLFLSQGNATTVKQFALPKGATKCDEVSIAPSGKLAAAQCTFSTGAGIAIIDINGQTVGKVTKKIITGFTPSTTEWVTDSTLIVAGQTETAAMSDQYNAFTVKNGRVSTVKNLPIDNSALLPAGTVFSGPFQILRMSKTKFYYNLLNVGLSAIDANNIALSSLIGLYNLTTDSNTTLINDGQWNLLTEAPTTGS